MHFFASGKTVSSVLLPLVSVCFIAMLAACGNPSVTTTGTISIKNTLRTTSVTLKHSPVGSSTLKWDPTTSALTVTIQLTGLAPNSTHSAHIHAGTCAADGAVIYPLSNVVANAKGDATSTTTIANVSKGIPATGWYVNVHNGDMTQGMTAIIKRPISCGNVSNSNSTHSVFVKMTGTIGLNESAHGKAAIVREDGKFALKITLSGLEPNSVHVAHIHSGTCAAQGPVVLPLNPVQADATGNGTSTTPLTQLPVSATGLYVNVHTGAAMADLAQSVFFNPIACGNLF